MGNPFALQIFYPDGDPENMRVATKMGWTGTVFYISRKYWKEGTGQYQDDLAAPGVYILAQDNDDDNDDLQTIYIGQSENLLTRLGEHTDDPNRDFQYIVCATGGDINNVHCRWMEAHLIEQAKIIDRCTLDNRARPSKPKIKNSEMVGITQFLEDVLQIFPIVEVKAFLAAKTVTTPTTKETITPHKRSRLGKTTIAELKASVVDAFQKQKNIKLLNRSKATFYDESKTIHVCCTVSREYKNQQWWWFSAHKTWIDFLERGEKGYLVFGMHGNSKAISFPVKEFNKIKDKLNSKLNEEGEALWWYVQIIEDNENIKLKLQGKGERFTIPLEYIINIT